MPLMEKSVILASAKISPKHTNRPRDPKPRLAVLRQSRTRPAASTRALTSRRNHSAPVALPPEIHNPNAGTNTPSGEVKVCRRSPG